MTAEYIWKIYLEVGWKGRWTCACTVLYTVRMLALWVAGMRIQRWRQEIGTAIVTKEKDERNFVGWGLYFIHSKPNQVWQSIYMYLSVCVYYYHSLVTKEKDERNCVGWGLYIIHCKPNQVMTKHKHVFKCLRVLSHTVIIHAIISKVSPENHKIL